jgi:hypothetical protein
VLNTFHRAIGFYVGGGVALTFLCIGLLFTEPPQLTAAGQRRARRHAKLLLPAGLVHPVFAAAALLLAKDLERLGDPAPTLVPLASASLLTSLVVMGAVLMTVA